MRVDSKQKEQATTIDNSHKDENVSVRCEDCGRVIIGVDYPAICGSCVVVSLERPGDQP